jgi:hypothetical protein
MPLCNKIMLGLPHTITIAVVRYGLESPLSDHRDWHRRTQYAHIVQQEARSHYLFGCWHSVEAIRLLGAYYMRFVIGTRSIRWRLDRSVTTGYL